MHESSIDYEGFLDAKQSVDEISDLSKYEVAVFPKYDLTAEYLVIDESFPRYQDFIAEFGLAFDLNGEILVSQEVPVLFRKPLAISVESRREDMTEKESAEIVQDYIEMTDMEDEYREWLGTHFTQILD